MSMDTGGSFAADLLLLLASSAEQEQEEGVDVLFSVCEEMD